MILMHPRQVGSVRQVTEERVDVAPNRSTLQVRADLADHYGWSCRPPGPTREPRRVTACETLSHHARCAIEAKRGRGAGTSPAAGWSGSRRPLQRRGVEPPLEG